KKVDSAAAIIYGIVAYRYIGIGHVCIGAAECNTGIMVIFKVVFIDENIRNRPTCKLIRVNADSTASARQIVVLNQIVLYQALGGSSVRKPYSGNVVLNDVIDNLGSVGSRIDKNAKASECGMLS